MIQVTITEREIEINGHAGYAPIGYDIVCSSVSILVQNFIQSIQALTNDVISYGMQPGAVHIHFKSNLSDSVLLPLIFSLEQNNMHIVRNRCFLFASCECFF